MNIFAEEERETLFEGEPAIRAKHPVMSSDGRALWNRMEAWVWVLAEPDGETFDIQLDCATPYPAWLDYVLECETFGNTLFPEAFDGAKLAQELLGLGVAPNQPFFIHLRFSCGVDYHASVFGEGWNEMDWELRAVELLDPKEALRRWEAWLELYLEGS